MKQSLLSQVLTTLFFFNASLSLGHAATEDGTFAIKGGGLQSCESFIASFDTGSRDLALYSGWIDGYVTGQNQYSEDTFDFFPWQTAETVLGMVRLVCEQSEADTPFSEAVVSLLRAVSAQRLRDEAIPRSFQGATHAVVVYDAVLDRAKEKLTEKGYLPKSMNAHSDKAVSDAFVDFQESAGLEPTGIPDQKTLTLLFVR